MVVEPCLAKKITEGAGVDFLDGIPLPVRILYYEVSKLAQGNTLADLEAEVLQLTKGGMHITDIAQQLANDC